MFRTIITASFVAAVSAHQNFHQFWVNGVTPGYQVGIRMPPSNSPVTDVTSNDIACNVDGSVVPSGVETVAANEGDQITVGWDASGHPGPITHFLFGPVDDAAQATGIGAGWFKIDELDYTNGTWANEVLENNGGNYTFSLPTGLASGDYLLRSEMLALHGAQTVGGAQFYIGCAQLKVTGTGSGTCTPTISLPGAYGAEDDDIYIPDVYNGFDPTTYTAPGGAVATCGSGSGGGSAVASSTAVAAPSTAVAAPSTAVASPTAPASSAAATATSEASAPTTEAAEPTTTSAAQVPSSAAPMASSAASSAQPTTAAAPSTLITATRAATSSAAAAPTGGVTAASLYGQCGGASWTGATTCAEGTCVSQNSYYSQCVNA